MFFSQLLGAGGFTLVILIGCSVLSIGIIIERVIFYKALSKIKRPVFMAQLNRELSAGNIPRAVELCKRTDTPFANVVGAGLNLFGHNETVISNAMEREVTIEVIRLEQRTGIIGTIGSTAVYIGLFGTVLGIIRAFRDIATSGSGGINVVINGIAEALICTAAGLCVAVPAVIAFNYVTRRVDGFITDMELCVSETMDLLNRNRK
ncbi:MAG: MotA/TolQ/ExbB proton channel family protein [Candidatus Omnitrophica bacterium]|nr:MotA/TolQ/ExbB proton channel family protein [Candidatus Omnitrophota bacterium]